MEVKYGLLLKKSWFDLKNNLIVFLPIVFALLFIIGGIILISLEIVLSFALGLTFTTSSIILLSAFWVFFIIIDLVVFIYLASIIGAMYVGLLNAIVTKKKANTNDMWQGARKFTNLYFKVDMIQLSIFLVPLLVIAILVGLAFLLSKGLGIALLIILGSLFILYLIAAVLVVYFGFFFIHPIMSLGKIYSPLELIKSSLKYTRANLSHVLLAWLIIFVINLVLGTINQLVSLPAGFSISIFLTLLPILLILFIIGIIVNTWLRIFLFNAYFNPKLKKL